LLQGHLELQRLKLPFVDELVLDGWHLTPPLFTEFASRLFGTLRSVVPGLQPMLTLSLRGACSRSGVPHLAPDVDLVRALEVFDFGFAGHVLLQCNLDANGLVDEDVIEGRQLPVQFFGLCLHMMTPTGTPKLPPVPMNEPTVRWAPFMVVGLTPT
jgi:hypothetical protein